MRSPARRWTQLARAGERGAATQLLWYATAAAGVALVTLLIGSLRNHVEPSRLQMSYLLLVLALAIGGGRGPAIFASVLAFLTFDWWFVTPVGNLVISNGEELFALGLFLVVGISTGSLAAGLKRSAAEAQRRTRDTATLYELSMAILADTSLGHVLGTIADRLVAALELEAAAVLLADADGALHRAACTSMPPELAALVVGDGEPARLFSRSPAQGAPELASERGARCRLLAGGRGARLWGVYVPLALNGRPLGMLAAYAGNEAGLLSADAQRMLEAFAAQTALAIGRVRLIEEEERAHAAAESDRMKSAFLASISHDLRTPLTAIRTAAALLYSAPDRRAKQEAKSNLDVEADRLNHLVGNLLEMSRIEGGSAQPHLLPEDVTELVGTAANRMTPLLAGRQLDLNAAADLPLLLLDAAQIDRVLVNLLENAIKFSPPDSTITVDVRAEGDATLIRVHNEGSPIPAEEQRRIFDKFHRTAAGERAVAGTGLGLAICKGIIEAHGGRIWTQNEANGVAFYVSLPASLQHNEAAPPAQRVLV